MYEEVFSKQISRTRYVTIVKINEEMFELYMFTDEDQDLISRFTTLEKAINHANKMV